MALKIYEEIGESLPAYQILVDASTPSGYADITSVTNIEKYAFKYSNFDYIYVTNAMKEFVSDSFLNHSSYLGILGTPPSSPTDGDLYLIDSGVDAWFGKNGLIAKYVGLASLWTFHTKEEIGFEQLSSAEQIIAASYDIGTIEQKIDTISTNNLVSYLTLHRANIYQAKEVRLSRMLAEICVRLYYEYDNILKDIVSDGLMVSYLQGIDGVLYGTMEGITDYINGTIGSSYEKYSLVEGLRHKDYIPVGLTLDDLCDHLIEILTIGTMN